MVLKKYEGMMQGTVNHPLPRLGVLSTHCLFTFSSKLAALFASFPPLADGSFVCLPDMLRMGS